MTVTCPSGHASATADYCDQCGARIAPPEAQTPVETRPPPAAHAPAETNPPPQARPDSSVVTSTSSVATPCPDCGAPRAGGDRFCEGCGYDFVEERSGRGPAAAPTDPTTWTAVVNADREYFGRVAPEGLEFPAEAQARTIPLDAPELRIGRARVSADIRPEIDLGDTAEDPAVSRLHATLVRQDDGSYSVIDQGSSNGTTINDDPTPIAAHVAVPLTDGDRVHLGAWTTITLRRTDDGRPPA